MINDKINTQTSGDNSTNYQAETMNIVQGISYSDAKEIALDVYKSNFLELSKEAKSVALQRAEELTDDFLNRLLEENKPAIEEVATPSMQLALYDAQKQYAKTGDKNLETLLVDILVKRASTPERCLKQIIYDESIAVASKLTSQQMDMLTLNLLISQPTFFMISANEFDAFYKKELLPIFQNASKTTLCFEHLEYAGCGSPMGGSHFKSIEEITKLRYSAFFMKPFQQHEVETIIKKHAIHNNYISHIFMRHTRKPTMFQLGTLNSQRFSDTLSQLVFTEQKHEKELINLYNQSIMSEAEIKTQLENIDPQVKQLLEFWTNSQISEFRLTTVGISIAVANFKRYSEREIDLSLWIE